MATVSFAEIERTASWAGDVRINLFRLGAIVIFYGHHVFAHFVLRESAPLGAEYHRRVPLVVLAWAASVLWLYLALRRPWSPPG